MHSFAISSGCGQRSKNISKLQASLAAQKLNDDGLPKQSRSMRTTNHGTQRKRPWVENNGCIDDESSEDADYIASTDKDDSADEDDCVVITNQEVCDSPDL